MSACQSNLGTDPRRGSTPGTIARIALWLVVGLAVSTGGSALAQQADLIVTKASNDTSLTIGQQLEFYIEVFNNGNSTADSIEITDMLPAGLTYDSSSATNSNGTYNSGTGIWALDNALADQDVDTLTMYVTVDVVQTDSLLTNTAFVSAMKPNDNMNANDTGQVILTLPVVDLQVTMTVDDNNPDTGGTVVYTIELANLRTDDASAVQVTDMLPTGLTFVSSTETNGSYNDAGGAWTLTGPVQMGSPDTLTITATVDPGQGGNSLVNTAFVSAVDQAQSDLANDTDAVSIDVQGADLRLLMTVNNSNPVENDSILFTLRLANLGPDPVTGVQVLDLLPSGLTYRSHSGTYNPGTGIWSLAGPIAPDSSDQVLLLAADVDPGTAGSTLDNVAFVQASSLDDGNRSNDTASASVSVNQPPSLTDCRDTSGAEGVLLTMLINATDPDGDSLGFSAINLPGGASFSGVSATSAQFAWAPNFSQAGVYNIQFVASDGSLADTCGVTITISESQGPGFCPPLDFDPTLVCPTSPGDSALFCIFNGDASNPIIIDTLGITGSTPGASFFSFRDSSGNTLNDFEGDTLQPFDTLWFFVIYDPTDTVESGNFYQMGMRYQTLGGVFANIMGFFANASSCTGQLQNISTVNFPTTEPNATYDTTVRLINEGTCVLTISQVSAAAPYSVIGTSSAVLQPNDTAVITVRFAPTSPGTYNRNLSIDNDQFTGSCPRGGTTNVSLSGNSADNQGPQIDVGNLTVSDSGRTVDVPIVDLGTSVSSASALWRLGNAQPSDTTRTAMADQGSNIWRLSLNTTLLPPDTLKKYGYEIDVRAVDGSANASTSGWLYVPGEFDAGYHNISRNALLGGNDSLWHLISIPTDLTNNSVAAVAQVSGLSASVSVGNPDVDKWRILNEGLGQLVPGAVGAVIDPDQGYWFRHFNQLNTLYLPAGATAATAPAPTLSIPPGNHLLGNRYLFDITLTLATLNSQAPNTLFMRANAAAPGSNTWATPLFTGGATAVAWPAWEAIYAYNSGGATESITLDAHAAPAPVSERPVVWSVDVSVAAADGYVGHTHIGVSPYARNGADLFDAVPLGMDRGRPALQVTGALPDRSLTYDIRRDDQLQAWQLDIEPEHRSRMELHWSYDRPPAEGLLLLLEDRVDERIIDMTAQSSYPVYAAERIPSERFRVLLGTEDDIQALLAGDLAQRPTTFVLHPNYPNPFNPSTTIRYELNEPAEVTLEIYNVLGQVVARPVRTYQLAGRYALEWNGTDDLGAAVSSGMYIVRLRVGQAEQTGKMLLLK